MDRFARGVVGHPWVILAVVAIVTGIFGYFARDVRIDSSVGTLVDSTDPAVRYYEEVRTLFGTEERDIVVIVADDIFTPPTLAKIKALSGRLARIPGVAAVTSLATEPTLRLTEDGDIDTSVLLEEVPASAVEIERLRAAVYDNPLFVGNLVSADGRAAALLVTYEPMSEAAFAEHVVHERIEAALTEAQGPERIFFAGVPTLKVQAAHLMRSEVLTFGPISFLVICMVLLAAFRTVRGMLLPAVTTGIGVVWTVGLMAYFDVPIDIGTLVLPTLLIAVGNAYATHVVARYYEELEHGGTSREITIRILRHLGIPVLVTALTTVLGFASLIVYRISAIRHLGYFSVFGITVLFVLALTFTAALLVLLRIRDAGRGARGEVAWIARSLERLGRFDIRHRAAIMLVSAVLLVGFGWGIRYVRVETSYLSYFPKGSSVRTSTAAISEYLGGGQATFLVMIDGPEENSIVRLDTLQRIAALQDFIERLPQIDRTTSIVDYMKLLHRVFHDDDPAYFGLPDTDAAVEQYLLLLEPGTIEDVVTGDYSRAAIVVRSHLHSSRGMARTITRIERFARDAFPEGFSVRPTGSVVLLDRTADDLSQGQVQSVLTALAVVFVILSLQFLSPRFGLVAMVPNLIPIVVFFGVLGWSGISLSLATAMIASISLGIGVDEAVHLLAEFNHHVRRHADQRRAVLAALRSVGPPVIYNTLALVLGFAVLAWSTFVPLRQFGLLSVMNVVGSLLGDLVLLPALMVTTRFVTLWDVVSVRLGGAPHEEIPLFRGLRPSQARVGALMGVLRTAGRDEKIVRRGEPADSMYVVIRGRAAAVMEVEGRRVTLGEMGRGDVIGEMGLLRGRPRSADVVALERTELLVVDERFFRVLRERYPRIASTMLFNLSKILSDRLEHADEQLLSAPGAARVS